MTGQWSLGDNLSLLQLAQREIEYQYGHKTRIGRKTLRKYGRASGSAAVDMRLKVARLGDSVLGDNFYTEEPWTIALGSSPIGIPEKPFSVIRPNSRLLMQGQASTGTISVYAGFMGVFADIVT